MASRAEIAAMRRAIDAAREPASPSPNPRVGCVLLDADGETLAIGAHEGAGQPHAEIEALVRAGSRARGATAVVTLEPCNHTGRTGPCAQALLEAGVARVVIAAPDPNPEATGGAQTLGAAGVDVETGVLADEAADLNTAWLFAVSRGRPYVTWKFAATLDGRSAATDGSSRWITGASARRDVHRRRAGADAIVVGTGTVVTDDPQLTVRDADDAPVERQPLRVVVGERNIPEGSRVLNDVATTLHLRTRDPRAVLSELAEREIRHVWLEGGPTLAGAFWRAGLVDEVIAYLAPAVLGDGPAALQTGSTTIGDLGRLDIASLAVLDGDVRLIAHPAGQES